MNTRFLSRVALVAMLYSAISLATANPSIEEEPDFYSMPGLNAQRSYEVKDNLVVDTFSGTLQTHSVDMVLQGTGPDIVVQRSYNSVPSVLSEYSYMGPGWDIHFGRMVGNYTCVDGVYTQSTLKLFFIKPDGSQVQILKENVFFLDVNTNGVFDAGTDYLPELTTSEFWRAECRGNQLVISDTQGTNFYLGASDSPDVFARYVVVKVEDLYGQSVEVEYELENAFSRPTRVSSADGREVLFTYDGYILKSVSDGSLSDVDTVSVNYTYTNGHLSGVEYPESFVWEYGYKDNTRLLSSVITPLGASITIGWDNYFFQNKDYPVVNSKCIETDCWTYTYQREFNNGTNIEDLTIITTPYFTREEYHHVTPLSVTNGEIWKIGLLTRKDVYREGSAGWDPNDIDPCSAEGGVFNADTPINSITYDWDGVRYSDSDRVYQNTGVFLIDQDFRKPMLRRSEENVNNSAFVYEVISRYPGGFPEIIKESGNITRYTKNTYFYDGDIQGSWLIGLPAASYISDHDGDYKYVSGVDYNEYGRVMRRVEQGVETRFDYDVNGNLYSVTDGAGYTTYNKNYHRGIPQLVEYPDDTSISRVVDDRGRITSETNQKLITTYFDYDDLDRVVKIDLPLTLDVEVTYSSDGEYRRFTKGSLRETYRYNKLGDLIQHTREDLSSGKQFVRDFEYDARNQLTFESYVNDTKGTFYKYNRLGELVKVRTSGGEVVVHDYNNYAQTTTDAMCNETVRSFDAVSASDQYLANIVGPEGLMIDIERNVMGQPLRITQNGFVRTYSYNDYWQVKTHKDPEEDATRSFEYDAAGRVASMRAGLVSNQDKSYVSTYSYDSMGRLETLAYSALYVVDQSSWDLFPPESCGSINYIFTCYYQSHQEIYSYGYDEVGNTKSKVKTTAYMGWSKLSPTPVTYEKSTSWSYAYDDEGHMLSEELISTTEDIYRISYEYNDYGYLNIVVYPNGIRAGYRPDLFGRPSIVRSIVTDIEYYDEGAVKELVYGNGMVASYTLNELKLIDTFGVSVSNNSLVDLKYDYDLNRNVKLIQDNSILSKTLNMEYDGLDRLVIADGAWGIGRYNYDSMSNILSKTIGVQNYSYGYDGSSNRLTEFNGNAVEYDIYGRVIDDGENRYFYDYVNNMTRGLNTVNGEEVNYRYDANNRLEYSSQNGGEVYVYNDAGRLMYEMRDYGTLRRNYLYLGERLIGFHEERSPCEDDTDRDGMGLCYEVENSLDYRVRDDYKDLDGDGLTNLEEYELGTRANVKDSDEDGVDDGDEVSNGLNPLEKDADGDPDNDGFTNIEEVRNGTDPFTFSLLQPARNFSAKYASQSVVVSWRDVVGAEGYDLYWSEVPFSDISDANLVVDVTSPFIDSVSPGGGERYYRLVSKLRDLRSEATEQRYAKFVSKQWVFAGALNSSVGWETENIGMDAAGNLHLLLNSSEVAYWDRDFGDFQIFQPVTGDLTKYDGRLAVSSNGDAMYIANARTMFLASKFDLETKKWLPSELLFRDSEMRQSSTIFHGLNISNNRLVASDNGYFVYTWQLDRNLDAYVQIYSPQDGWADAVRIDTASIKNSIAINNQGVVALAYVSSSAEGLRSANLVTVDYSGMINRYKIDGNYDDSYGGVRVGLNDAGEGILVWSQGYSQRFNMQGLVGSRTPMPVAGFTLKDLVLNGDKATVFFSQNNSLNVVVQEGASDWSSPFVFDPDKPFTNRPWVVHDGSVQFESSREIFGYSNGNLDLVTKWPAISHWLWSDEYSSNITLAGDFAVILTDVDEQGYPVFIYTSKELEENIPPDLDAGPDLVVLNTDTFFLSPPAQYSDQDGVVADCRWEQLSGPDIGFFSSPPFNGSYSHNCHSLGLRNLSNLTDGETGEWEFQLTATDDRGGQAADTVRVTVLETLDGAPTAKAGDDSSVIDGSLVQLDASNSVALPQNPITSFLWEQISGPSVYITNAEAAKASFVAPKVESGSQLEFRVTVSAGSEVTYSDTDTVAYTIISSDFDLSITTSYSDQDSGNGSVESSVNAVTLIGNHWRAVSGAVFTLTADTVLEFDFVSDGLGEIPRC